MERQAFPPPAQLEATNKAG